MIRPLKGFENNFANPILQDNIFLSIKFSDSNTFHRVASNFLKIFSGLRLKIKDGHYYQKEEREIPIHPIPNWIQDCKLANQYVFNNQMPSYKESLASISANDKILVINSCHTLCDGGSMISVLSKCLDDFTNEKPNEGAPIYFLDAFKDQCEEAEIKFDKNNLWPMNKLTSCKYDTNDKHLAPPGTQLYEMNGCIPCEDLACYNKATKKIHGLSDVINVGVSMSVLALNTVNNGIQYEYDNPLSMASIIDVKRFGKPSKKINWNLGNCIAVPSIKADVSKSDTIDAISKKFRNYINTLKPFGAFYCASHVNELLAKQPPKSIVGCHSAIGPVKFKHPIIDMDLKDGMKLTPGKGDHGELNGTLFEIISYSKINEYRNDLIYMANIWPSGMTLEKGRILFDSFTHFITKVPVTASFDDTLEELIDFQKSIKRKY
ncbi:hypothetical protein M9Y10_003178 [Tritrichomonas musculus]|uniref:Condensation domain-containing protein n=1 Tax=Tritrichomonas musculus TaxID=1915356 RepID=A0ABR2JQJ4_9EUKA